MRNIILAATALTLLAAPAFAQSVSGPSYYGTLGYSALDDSDGDLGAVTGRLGAKFSPYIGVEGEASFGVRDDDFSFGGVDGSVELDYDVAAYAVGTYPVTPNLELFGRVGYGKTELNIDVAGFTDEASGESVNYGAGANYYLDAQNGIRADWTRRDFRDDGGEADVYSLSYVRRF